MARTKTIEQLLVSSVDTSGDCWEWQKVVVRGYGQLTHNKKIYRAHRFVYEALVGKIPRGLQLDHLCRNPICVNPTHLEPVTMHENILRGESIAAENARKTHCLRGHEFTPENTYTPPLRRNHRYCRTCQNERDRTYRLKMKGI